MKKYRVLGIGRYDAHYRASKSSPVYDKLLNKIITEKDMKDLRCIKPQSYLGQLGRYYFADIRIREIKNVRNLK